MEFGLGDVDFDRYVEVDGDLGVDRNGLVDRHVDVEADRHVDQDWDVHVDGHGHIDGHFKAQPGVDLDRGVDGLVDRQRLVDLDGFVDRELEVAVDGDLRVDLNGSIDRDVELERRVREVLQLGNGLIQALGNLRLEIGELTGELQHLRRHDRRTRSSLLDTGEVFLGCDQLRPDLVEVRACRSQREHDERERGDRSQQRDSGDGEHRLVDTGIARAGDGGLWGLRGFHGGLLW